MSPIEIKAVERATDRQRCAYCHGSLEGEIARCERCHAELHADCRATLGRCPTLGCTDRAERPVPLPTTWVTPLPHTGRQEGAWPRWLALAELYLVSSGGAAFFALCSLLLVAAIVGVTVAIFAVLEGPGSRESVFGVAGMAIFALFLAWLSRGAFRTAREFVRGASRARTLLRGNPTERLLVATMESNGKTTAVNYALESRTNRDPIPGWIPLRSVFMVSPGWARTGSSPVRVYGLGEEGPIILESARGRLLVAVRETPRPRGRRRP